jgi:hypothetical protein
LAGTVRPGPAGALWALLTGSTRPPVLTGRVGARATVPGTAWAALPRLVGTWAALAGASWARGLTGTVWPSRLAAGVGARRTLTGAAWPALAGTVRASGLASAVRPTGLTGRVGT